MKRFFQIGLLWTLLLSVGLVIPSAPIVGQAPAPAPGRAGGAQTLPVVSQPTGWTAFDADLTSFDVDGSVTAVGRYYRASDGSSRQDMRSDKTGSVASRIINIRQERAYTFLQKTNTWIAQPAVWLGDVYAPLPGDREIGANHLTRVADYEGLEAYQRNQTNGTAADIKIPLLNMFTVQLTSNGHVTRKVTNIRVRPQSADLFVLPADATVQTSDKPFELVKSASASH